MVKLKVAVICSSNMNRSMEAHSVFAKRDFQVSSYGTGDKVKIPGKHPRGIFFSKVMLPENCLGSVTLEICALFSSQLKTEDD